MLARQRHLRCFSEKQVKKLEGEKSIVVARQGPRRRTSAQVKFDKIKKNEEKQKVENLRVAAKYTEGRHKVKEVEDPSSFLDFFTPSSGKKYVVHQVTNYVLLTLKF